MAEVSKEVRTNSSRLVSAQLEHRGRKKGAQTGIISEGKFRSRRSLFLSAGAAKVIGQGAVGETYIRMSRSL